MSKIFIVTEGQAETNFVNKIMSPYFATRCVLIPITVITSIDRRHGRMYKGGVINYDQIRNTLTRTLSTASKSEDAFVTTMFDYFCLPKDVPGSDKAKELSNPYDRTKLIERSIQEFEKYDNHKFFPYIEQYEFEAMIFSDVEKLGEVFFEHDITTLIECVRNQGNPELINGGPETSPSKRIISCIKTYDKVTDGVDVLEKIGIERIMKKCSHFAEWVNHIEERI